MRDELRRPVCGEILEYVDDMKANSFEEKIMYDTALLTQSHVFDDDSLTSSFDKTSEDFTVPTRAIDGNNRDVCQEIIKILVYTTNCSYSSWQSKRFYELFARVLWGDWLHLFERYTRSTNAEMTRTLNYHYISTLFYCKRCCADIESTYSRVLYKLVDTFTLDNLRSMWKEITINLMGISQ